MTASSPCWVKLLRRHSWTVGGVHQPEANTTVFCLCDRDGTRTIGVYKTESKDAANASLRVSGVLSPSLRRFSKFWSEIRVSFL